MSSSVNLPLSDKFNYPVTMLQFSSFADFQIKQPKTIDHDDNLIARLAGLGIQESNINMSMFEVKPTSDSIPYTTFETPPGWEEAFESKSSKYELEIIKTRLQEQWKKGNIIFPLESDIFDTFKRCPPSKVKVVILGQDPYHQMDQILNVPIANGKAFSLRLGGQNLGSLDNIFTEIKRTYPDIPLEHCDLSSWVEQGVLLLNTQLTVNKNAASSHSELKIWNYWIEYIIKWICDNCPGVIFLLWGAKAATFTQGDIPPIGKRIFKRLCGHPSSKNTSAAPFANNGHFADIYYEIERQNQVTYEKNNELYSLGQPLLPYKEQINWALVNPKQEIKVNVQVSTNAVVQQKSNSTSFNYEMLQKRDDDKYGNTQNVQQYPHMQQNISTVDYLNNLNENAQTISNNIVYPHMQFSQNNKVGIL